MSERTGIRLMTAGVSLLFALSACTSAEPASTKPTFGGGGDGTTVAPDDLAAAKTEAGIEDCPAAGDVATGDNALPGLTLECLGGGTPVDLSTLTGAPTVINIWASWCVPCRKELPILAKANREYGDAVRFIGVDYQDENPDHAIELARVSGVTYPQLSDPDTRTVSALKVAVVPQTVFVDAQGTIVATERIAYDSYADLAAAIERHLGVTP